MNVPRGEWNLSRDQSPACYLPNGEVKPHNSTFFQEYATCATYTYVPSNMWFRATYNAMHN